MLDDSRFIVENALSGFQAAMISDAGYRWAMLRLRTDRLEQIQALERKLWRLLTPIELRPILRLDDSEPWPKAGPIPDKRASLRSYMTMLQDIKSISIPYILADSATGSCVMNAVHKMDAKVMLSPEPELVEADPYKARTNAAKRFGGEAAAL